MKKLLIVVDMINGFINEGNLHDKGINDIIPACIEQIASCIEEKQDIIAFCDNHSKDSKEFKVYPKHCLSASRESDLVEELALYKDKMVIIPKNSTNGFFAPGFCEYKEKLSEYNEITLIGCCTDICVLQLALSLKAYCNEKDYDIKIKVVKNACDTFDIEGHSRGDYNDLSFSLMKSSGIEVV